MEHKSGLTDGQMRAAFIIHHVNIDTRIDVSPTHLLIDFAGVLGPKLACLSCTVLNGVWTFAGEDDSAVIPHDELHKYGLLA
jgi:hypothetical protein